MQPAEELMRPFEDSSDLVFVRWFRTKSGKIIHAAAYGKKCFVFHKKKKKDN